MLANPKIQEFLNLLQDPEVYGVFKGLVMRVLTDPDCFLLKRVSNIENHLGADEFYCIGEDSQGEDKEVIKTIPEQLALLSERIDDSSIPILKETVLVAGNETEVRARLLRDHLPSEAYRNGKKFMLGPEVQKFLLHEVPEEHRATTKGVRQATKEVMNKTLEMFPNEVRVGKNNKNRNFIEYIEKLY